MRCVGDGRGFCLESVDNGERWSRFSFVGRRPHAVLTATGRSVTVEGSLPDDDLPLDQGILAPLEILLDRYKAPRLDDLPPLTAGLVGYLGYDVVREVERLPNVPEDDSGYPDAVLEVIGDLAVFDHWRQRVTLVAVALLGPEASAAEVDAAYDDAITRLEQLAIDGAKPLDEPMLSPPNPTGPDMLDPSQFQTSLSADLYEAAVEAAKEYIRAGDIFQVVLSKRFDFKLDAEPIDVYRALRQLNPSPYMYFIRHPELTLVGCSPEPLVQVQDGRVISRPIAGTRQRGRTDEHDRMMAAELTEDPKERAEHVMLVDLGRNDLGRVCRPGSVRVTDLMVIERYSHVMHIVSQVEGLLTEAHSVWDLLTASFPAGTVSGAPKIRAMQLIHALEPDARGPYAGVYGAVDLGGALNTAITIRTMVVQPGERGSWRVQVQAGAGLVADSQPSAEYQETLNKARGMLKALACLA